MYVICLRQPDLVEYWAGSLSTRPAVSNKSHKDCSTATTREGLCMKYAPDSGQSQRDIAEADRNQSRRK
jgi:hypothetical protein